MATPSSPASPADRVEPAAAPPPPPKHVAATSCRAGPRRFGGKLTQSGISASGGTKEVGRTITAMTIFLVIAAIAVILFLVNGRHPLAGSGPAVEDRDAARLRIDLLALGAQAEPLSHKPLTTRPRRHTVNRTHYPSGPRAA